MSIKSTAAQLARLKVTYPRWQIYRASFPDPPRDEFFVADERYGDRQLTGTTPADLENELIRAAYE